MKCLSTFLCLTVQRQLDIFKFPNPFLAAPVLCIQTSHMWFVLVVWYICVWRVADISLIGKETGAVPCSSRRGRDTSELFIKDAYSETATTISDSSSSICCIRSVTADGLYGPQAARWLRCGRVADRITAVNWRQIFSLRSHAEQ